MCRKRQDYSIKEDKKIPQISKKKKYWIDDAFLPTQHLHVEKKLKKKKLKPWLLHKN